MSNKIDHYLQLTKLFKNLPSNDQYKCIRNNLMRLGAKKTHDNSGQKCQLCGISHCSTYRNRVLVPSKRPNRFLRRLLQNDTENRTAYQNLTLEKFDKYAAKQKLIYICPSCNYKETIMIARDIPASNENISIVDEQIRKVKKKKNNEFAGLNKSAVLTVKKARKIIQMDDIQIKRKLDTKPQLGKVVSVDNSRRMEIDNEQPETFDFISLVTPEITSKNYSTGDPKSSADITLQTPKTKRNQESDSSIIDLSSPYSENKLKNKAKIPETFDFISLVSPEETSKNYSTVDPKSSAVITLQTRKTKRNKKSNSSIIDLSSPYSENKLKNKAKKDMKKERKRKKKINVVLATTTPKSAKKAKKQDALAKLLQKDNKLENTVSNLEKFLNTISK